MNGSFKASGNTQTHILANGIEIPAIGFGTDCTFIYMSRNIGVMLKKYCHDLFKENCYHIKRDLSLYRLVRNAPEEKCFLFDTAYAYGQSEWILGKGLKRYQRDSLFITTKVSNTQQRCGDIQAALEMSLRRIGTSYIDLYLLHWPYPDYYMNSWKQMEQLLRMKKVRAIGVCNFHEHHLKQLEKYADIMPVVNQIECHPLMNQKKLRTYCEERNIRIMAYTPTARMDKRLQENDQLRCLAEKYNKSIAQIILRWHYQLGNIPIVNTTKLKHLKENMNIFDFALSDSDISVVDSINIDCRLRYNPDTCDFTKL